MRRLRLWWLHRNWAYASADDLSTLTPDEVAAGHVSNECATCGRRIFDDRTMEAARLEHANTEAAIWREENRHNLCPTCEEPPTVDTLFVLKEQEAFLQISATTYTCSDPTCRFTWTRYTDGG